MKYSSYRIDVQPKRDEYQQAYRYLLPAIAIWADGTKYNTVGFLLGWWKWNVTVFFSTNQKEKVTP